MQLQAVFLLLALLILSGGAVLNRYRDGRLITPIGGLHVQILVLFSIGGILLLCIPDAEPMLYDDDLFELTLASCIPLVLGYVIVRVSEYLLEHRLRRAGIKKKPSMVGSGFRMDELAVLLLIGFGGMILGNIISGETTPTVASVYMALFFFPAILLSLINTNWFSAASLIRACTILVLAGGIGFYSPWRSVLVVFIFTVLLGISFGRPRWTFPACIVGFLLLVVLIPFQMVKRSSFEEFQVAPLPVVLESFEIELPERLTMMGDFVAKRMSYVRELVYVKAALDSGYEKKDGETYAAILLQLVPRILWPEKPIVAEWAGFDLPREIGLLQVGGDTSWAVNMFAEAAYNFGIWTLVWFVPLTFTFAQLLSILLRRLYRSEKTVAVGNVCAFYLFLSVTTVIFFASTLIALFVMLKLLDFWFSGRRKAASSSFARSFMEGERESAEPN